MRTTSRCQGSSSGAFFSMKNRMVSCSSAGKSFAFAMSPVRSGFFGKGVNVVTVQRAYNELMTVQAGAASSVAAADSARLDKLTQLESVFPIGSNGIGAAAGSLLNAFVDVSSNPTDSSARQVALSRQPGTNRPFTCRDQRAQLSSDLAVQALGFDGLEWHVEEGQWFAAF